MKNIKIKDEHADAVIAMDAAIWRGGVLQKSARNEFWNFIEEHYGLNGEGTFKFNKNDLTIEWMPLATLARAK